MKGMAPLDLEAVSGPEGVGTEMSHGRGDPKGFCGVEDEKV